MLEFEILGKPVAKQSARFTKSGFAFTPSHVVNYSNFVKLCFQQAFPNHLPSVFFEKALKVVITVYVKPPKSFTKKKLKLIEQGLLRPTVKPDCDNISKNILDSLNGLAYPDDRQITELNVIKLYGNDDFVRVSINEV